MRPQILALMLVVASGAATAQGCPPLPDRSEEMAPLLDRLAVAPDPATAQRLTAALWQIWTDAPDDRSQRLLDDGMQRRVLGDLGGAADLLDDLVAYCPGFAEGWNQRAFVHFLRHDFAASLADLERALELEPAHVGALSGRALALLGLGRDLAAQGALREALDRNPWLPERALLRVPPGTDL